MSAEEIYEILNMGPKSPGPGQPPPQAKTQAGAPGAGQLGPAPPTPPTNNLKLPPRTPDKKQQLDKIPELSKNSGLVMDAPINLKDNKEVQEFEENLDIALEQAIKNVGDLPGNLKQLIKAEEEHKIDYKDLLRDWLEKNVFPSDYNFMKPNRRYFSQGILLPGLDTEEELPNIVFGVDASGSVGKKEKKAFANEISGVLEEFPCVITAIYCDTRVSHTQDIDSDDYPIELDFHGGGGTNFSPVFKYIEEHGIEAEAVLYFTDLCCHDFGDDPGIPVLWLNTMRRNDTKDVPFGQVIPLELD
jgi:predicted metal-dependent peptidase